MELCRYGDVVLASDLSLGIPIFEGTQPQCSFHFFRDLKMPHVSCHWIHQYNHSNGEAWLSVARKNSYYLLRFHELAHFLISSDARKIQCYADSNIPSATIRHLFLDQVMPLVLSQMGRLVLHATAVVSSDSAIVFLGEAGRGKSTLAASFCQQGFSLITDDCLLITERTGEYFCIPSYPGLRLWDDAVSALFPDYPSVINVAHYTDKKYFGLQSGQIAFSTAPVPLKKAYLLASAGEGRDKKSVTITPLSPRDAFIEFVNCAYRLDLSNRKRLEEEFNCLSRISESVSVGHLAFPRDFSCLPYVRDAILTDHQNGTLVKR